MNEIKAGWSTRVAGKGDIPVTATTQGRRQEMNNPRSGPAASAWIPVEERLPPDDTTKGMPVYLVRIVPWVYRSQDSEWHSTYKLACFADGDWRVPQEGLVDAWLDPLIPPVENEVNAAYEVSHWAELNGVYVAAEEK